MILEALRIIVILAVAILKIQIYNVPSTIILLWTEKVVASSTLYCGFCFCGALGLSYIKGTAAFFLKHFTYFEETGSSAPYFSPYFSPCDLAHSMDSFFTTVTSSDASFTTSSDVVTHHVNYEKNEGEGNNCVINQESEVEKGAALYEYERDGGVANAYFCVIA